MSGPQIGIDIGGTTLKVGSIIDGRVSNPVQSRTPADFDECIAEIRSLVDRTSMRTKPCCIGVGVPGVIDLEARVVLDAPNLPWLEQQPLGQALEDEFGVAVAVENDASAAAYGEARFGAGQGHPDFLLATIGTGIGGGIVLGGKLFRGSGGMAGEFGHLPVGHDRICACGARGCLEAAVAAPGIVETARENELVATDLPDLADRARRNQKGPQRIFQQAGVMLGEALAQVALLLDLRVFLIGGGGGPILDLLKPAALGTLSMRAFGRTAADFTLDRALLGNDAGMIGAATIAAEATPALSER